MVHEYDPFSNAIGNILTEDEQYDNLAMIVDLAEEVWGTA